MGIYHKRSIVWQMIVNRDMLLGIFMLLFATLFFVYIKMQPWAKIQYKGYVGPGTVPLFLTIIIFVLGIMIIGKTYYLYKRRVLLRPTDRLISIDSVIIILAGLGFILLMENIGFIFTSILFLAFLSWYGNERNWIRIVIISIFSTIMIYLASIYFLRIVFPPGNLWKILNLF